MFKKFTCVDGNKKYHDWGKWEHEEKETEIRESSYYGYGNSSKSERSYKGMTIISRRYCSRCNELQIRHEAIEKAN